MDLIVPQWYLEPYDGNFKDRSIDGDLVSEWVESEENLDYMNNLLIIVYRDKANQYGNPILAKIDVFLNEAVKIHISLCQPYLGKRGFISNIHYMSLINSCIFIHVKDKIDSLSENITIDPLWTQKGPGFKATKKEWNRPGATWGVELGPMGTPQVMPRFSNSKMYWNKPSFTQKLNGNDFVDDSNSEFDRI